MFLSHANSLNFGEYLPLNQYNKEKVLIKSDNYSMTSNTCPHQRSIISESIGKGNRTCPYHAWQFTFDGNPVSSGETHYYCKNNNKLTTYPVYEWSNLLFDSEILFDQTFDFSNLMLMEQRTDIVNSPTKNIMNVFLDVDHIPIVHNGVYESIGFDTVTVNSVKWSYYDGGSIQQVKDNALWIAVYPNTMIEWQSGCLFITVALEYNNQSKVIVYKYRNKDMSDYDWFKNEQAWEMAWSQDKHQAEILQSPSKNLEPAKLHFKNWLDNNGSVV